MLNWHYDCVQHTEYLSLFLSILLKLEHFKNNAVQIFVTWDHFFMVYVSHLYTFIHRQADYALLERILLEFLENILIANNFLGIWVYLWQYLKVCYRPHMINLRIAIYWSRLTASREIEHFITSNITSKQQPNINLTETAGSFLLNAS